MVVCAKPHEANSSYATAICVELGHNHLMWLMMLVGPVVVMLIVVLSWVGQLVLRVACSGCAVGVGHCLMRLVCVVLIRDLVCLCVYRGGSVCLSLCVPVCVVMALFVCL